MNPPMFDRIIDENTVDDYDGLGISYRVIHPNGTGSFLLSETLDDAVRQAEKDPEEEAAVERTVYPLADRYDVVEHSIAWAGPKSPWLPYVGKGSADSFNFMFSGF